MCVDLKACLRKCAKLCLRFLPAFEIAKSFDVGSLSPAMLGFGRPQPAFPPILSGCLSFVESGILPPPVGGGGDVAGRIPGSQSGVA